MKIGIYSDAHFSRSSSIWNQVDGYEYSSRLDTLIKSYLWMYDLFQRFGVELILNLGDTYSSDRVDAVTQSALSKAISSHKDLKEYWLLGNHEIYTKDSDKNSLALLEYHQSYIELIKKGKVIQLSDGTIIIMQSYQFDDNIDWIVKTLEFYKDRSRIIVCTHQMYEGILPIAGGADWSKIFDYKNVKRLFNGHIHNRLIKDKYVQVGSLVSNSFGDDYSGGLPGATIYDTSTDHVIFENNPFTPLFITGEYEILDSTKSISLNPDRYSSSDKKFIKDHNLPLFLRVKAGISEKDSVKELIANDKQIVDYRLQLYNDSEIIPSETPQVVNKLDIYEALKSYILSEGPNLPVSQTDLINLVSKLQMEESSK